MRLSAGAAGAAPTLGVERAPGVAEELAGKEHAPRGDRRSSARRGRQLLQEVVGAPRRGAIARATATGAAADRAIAALVDLAPEPSRAVAVELFAAPADELERRRLVGAWTISRSALCRTAASSRCARMVRTAPAAAKNAAASDAGLPRQARIRFERERRRDEHAEDERGPAGPGKIERGVRTPSGVVAMLRP